MTATTDRVAPPNAEDWVRAQNTLEMMRADRHRLIEEANGLHALCDKQHITINNLEAEVAALRADIAVLSERIRRDSAAETRRVDQMMDAFVSPGTRCWYYRKVDEVGYQGWQRATSPDGPWEYCDAPFRDVYGATSGPWTVAAEEMKR